MTLGVPLANGAFREREFWEHAAFVLVIPLALVTLVLFIRVIASLAGRMPATRRQDVGDPITSLRPRRGLADPAMLSQDFDQLLR